MFLSKHPRSKVYYLYFFEGTKRKSISTRCTKKRDAANFLAEFKEQQALRASEKVIPVRLRDAIWQYLKHSERIHRPKTHRDIKNCLKAFQKAIGANAQLHDITIPEIEAFLAAKQRRSIHGAKNFRMYLKGFFQRARILEHVSKNPIDRIPPIKAPEKTPSYFSREQAAELPNLFSDPVMRDLVQTALHSGMRLMEILSLRPEQVNLQQNVINLDNRNGSITKNKRTRVIPMTAVLRETMLRRIAAAEGELLFHYEGSMPHPDTVSKKFKTTIREAGYSEALHFHSTRHTYASQLIQNGVPLLAVSRLLGHSNPQTTTIYAHLRTDDLVNAVQTLNP